MQESTRFKHIRKVRYILDRLVDDLNEVLQERLVGIYLYGSLIIGDFDMFVSDIDFVVVLNGPIDAQLFTALHDLHTRVVADYPQWQNRLELAYISSCALRTFRTQPSNIGIISPGEPFHIIEAGSDWLISWYALRENGIALQGPPIRTLIDPIPEEAWLDALREHICHYHESVRKPQNKASLSYIVLTVARGLYTLEHGHAVSKVKAAEWAAHSFPKWSDLIERALLYRQNPQADTLTAEQMRPEVVAYLNDLLSGNSCED